MKASVFKTLICLFVILAPVLQSCSKAQKSAEDILYRICASVELPAGSTYLSQAEEGEENYLSPDTASALYGARALEEKLPLVEEYAIYLAASAPCEIAVFKCRSRSDTDGVAEMCLERADALGALMKGTALDGLYGQARVTKHKKYVVMILCEDHERALDAARTALK